VLAKRGRKVKIKFMFEGSTEEAQINVKSLSVNVADKSCYEDWLRLTDVEDACRINGVQNCHFCHKLTCGDNTALNQLEKFCIDYNLQEVYCNRENNELRVRIEALEKELAKKELTIDHLTEQVQDLLAAQKPVDFDAYQEWASRTSGNDKFGGYERRRTHALLGIAGEAGELIDAFKKAIFFQTDTYGIQIMHDVAFDEIGDLLWYMSELATVMNWKLSDIARKNIDKVKHRYPDGFVTGGGNRDKTIFTATEPVTITGITVGTGDAIVVSVTKSVSTPEFAIDCTGVTDASVDDLPEPAASRGASAPANRRAFS
jgi:NTP pyrophosphatase (non-canonical NTP hydrolase)